MDLTSSVEITGLLKAWGAGDQAAMERLTAAMQCEGRSIAALYASNTFGAVLGVLAAAFWLIPGIGLTKKMSV